MSPEDYSKRVASILALTDEGVSRRQIAKNLGLHPATVTRIIRKVRPDLIATGGPPRLSTCKVCGGPRDNTLVGYAFCSVHWKEHVNRYRTQAIVRLGGKCVVCSFDDVRALQIDHVNGGGGKELKKLGPHGVYKRALLHPEDYQVLCANHNWIKRAERGET